MHHEIPVKVTAWVDEGIARLVLALNALDGVMTLDSCQGDEGGNPARVFFCHRSDARNAVLFVSELAAMLAPCEAIADYTLTAEWRPGTDEPRFRLACPAAQADALARALSAASESARGSRRTALRS
jgi:hypothetical protein